MLLLCEQFDFAFKSIQQIHVFRSFSLNHGLFNLASDCSLADAVHVLDDQVTHMILQKIVHERILQLLICRLHILIQDIFSQIHKILVNRLNKLLQDKESRRRIATNTLFVLLSSTHSRKICS